MASLSFEDGKAIGIIRGGKHHNKILYINTDEKNKEERKELPFDKMVLLDKKFFNNAKARMKLLDLEKLKRALKVQKEPEEEHLKEMYHEANAILDGKINKEIELHDGEIIPIPNFTRPDNRQTGYICGPSGAGKSTYISWFAKQYKNAYPDRDIIVFSRLDDDKVIDDLNPMRIMIDKKMIKHPIKPSELKNSLVIFDDTDTIPDKKLQEAVNKLKDDLLQVGRHENVTLLTSSHLINNYKMSRIVLVEAHFLVFFPSGNAHQIKYCLDKNVGMTNKQIKKLLSLPSRWVCVHKEYPMCVMYSKGCYLL